jgi:hypothetical protein
MMRRAALFLICLVLAGSGAALAQSRTGSGLELRGPASEETVAATPQSETPADSPPALSALPVAAPVFSSAGLVDGGAQCRLTCAQDYYFCLASELSDDCPGAWGQCRAACAAGARGVTP